MWPQVALRNLAGYRLETHALFYMCLKFTYLTS